MAYGLTWPRITPPRSMSGVHSPKRDKRRRSSAWDCPTKMAVASSATPHRRPSGTTKRRIRGWPMRSLILATSTSMRRACRKTRSKRCVGSAAPPSKACRAPRSISDIPTKPAQALPRTRSRRCHGIAKRPNSLFPRRNIISAPPMNAVAASKWTFRSPQPGTNALSSRVSCWPENASMC